MTPLTHILYVKERPLRSQSNKGTAGCLALAVVLVLVLSTCPAEKFTVSTFQEPANTFQAHFEAAEPAQKCSGERLPAIITPPTHISFAENFCQFNTTISYTQNATSGGTSFSYNISFSMDGLAEVSPEGQIVRYSNFSWITPVSHFANYTDNIGSDGMNVTANVTEASGAWTPNGI